MKDPLVNLGTEEFWEKARTKVENGVSWRIVGLYKNPEGFWVVEWRNKSGETVSQNLATKEYHNAKCQLVEQIHGRNLTNT